MFRDLARCTARLKGARYDGAVIAAATWSRQGNGAALEADTMPTILLDCHRMIRVQATDTSGTLTLTMLLGRKAPSVREADHGVLQLTAEADGVEQGDVRLMFTADEVRSFVHDVDDTNPLHEGTRPLVPGLLMMETLLKRLDDCKKLSMKFTTPTFVGQEVEITFAGGSRAGR
ncbi:hypothetical protein [uncultured Selenomonas sp.]|uniref:hypothetical protein n=1 Tax=uncultured Selenomonas sp. TaxID=159275 RepID=UPI0025DF5097|nr:hypothetical protein [uncultured Selenomonas sp.]